MSNTTNNEVQYNTSSTSSSTSSSPSTFQVIERRIPNPHSFQFYATYGTQPGPWLAVGINDYEYAIGFLPEHYAPTRLQSVAV